MEAGRCLLRGRAYRGECKLMGCSNAFYHTQMGKSLRIALRQFDIPTLENGLPIAYELVE